MYVCEMNGFDDRIDEFEKVLKFILTVIPHGNDVSIASI